MEMLDSADLPLPNEHRELAIHHCSARGSRRLTAARHFFLNVPEIRSYCNAVSDRGAKFSPSILSESSACNVLRSSR